MKILQKILFVTLVFSSIQCFGDDSIEFRVAYETNTPDTYIYTDNYNRTLFVENKPSIALSDLLKINVIVEEEEPPPWLKSLERHPNISIPNKQIKFQVFFNKKGKTKLAKITSDNIGNFLVITINDEVVMAPTIQDKIDTGEAFITTGYTEKEAREFANKVNKLIKSD